MTVNQGRSGRAHARSAQPLARVLNRSRVPLYIQVATLLRRRIEDGVFKPGQRMPTLEELEQEFNVARVTVRQAVDLLQKEGLVWRQQGKGTFVADEIRERRWLRLAIDLNSLVERMDGNAPRFEPVGDPPAPRFLAGDGRPAADYVHMSSVQFRAGEPFALASVHVERAIHDLHAEAFATRTALPVVVRHLGDDIGRAHACVVVGSAEPHIAEALRIPLNTPTVEAHYVVEHRNGVVAYVSEIVYRGDCVRFDIDLLAAARPRELAEIP